MSQENHTTPPPAAAASMLGEISTIRNILMGQQMSEYDRRFEDLRNSLTNLSEENHRRLETFANETEERFGALEREMSERFDLLEKLMQERFTQLEANLKATSSGDRGDLSRLLREMADKFDAA